MIDAGREAELRYKRAKAREARVKREWHLAGCPLTTLGGATGRAVVAHPLLALISSSERDARLALAALGSRAHRGPKPSAVPEAVIGASPAARLRAVKSSG